MFDVFLIVRQLHEMLWYLTEAFRLQSDSLIQEEINHMISETVRLTNLEADSIIGLDLLAHRNIVNNLLSKTSELVRSKARRGQKTTLKRKKTIAGRLNFIGADLRKLNLIGEDLRGAFLIAADIRVIDLRGADLIGADLRDADIRGADLSRSAFITQAQINAAKGDFNTRLPMPLVRPVYWDK